MKAFKLKILVCLIFVVAVIIMAKVFRSSEPESTIHRADIKQSGRESKSNKEKSDSEAQSKEHQPNQESVVESFQIRQREENHVTKSADYHQVKTQPAVSPAKYRQRRVVKKKRPTPTAEELYQMALFCKKESAGSSYRDYEKVLEFYNYILKQYPASLEAEKARELLKEVPQQYQERFNDEMRLLNPPQPKVRKSRQLRRRPPMPYRKRNDVGDKQISISN